MRAALNRWNQAISTHATLSSYPDIDLDVPFEVIFRPTFNFLYTINRPKGQVYVDRFQVYLVSLNTASACWHRPSDYREYPINPEAAISNANLNLRGESAKRWPSISPSEWLQSGSFMAGQMWDGARETWTLKERKGTMRDSSQLQAHSVRSSTPAPSSVIWHRLCNHLNCFCPSVGLMKTENISSETPFLETESALAHQQIHKYFMLQISIFVRQHCTKQVNTACANHKDWANTKQPHVTSDSESLKPEWSRVCRTKQACTLRCEGCVLDCWPGSFNALLWDKAASCDSVRLNRQDKHRDISITLRTAEMGFQRFMQCVFQRGRTVARTVSSKSW